MPLPEKYQSPMSLLSKLRRLKSNLDEEVSWDMFVDFAVTAFHLFDWVGKDARTSETARSELNALRENIQMQACRDTANSHKHREITRYTPKIEDKNVDQGWGCGRWGAGGFGVGEEEISITMTDGTTYDGLELARVVLSMWEEFFERHSTIIPN